MRRFVACLAFLPLLLGSATAQDLAPYVADAEAVLQRLREEMMAEMQAAMAEGPAAAIGVCRHLAPEIEAEIEAETGWEVRRVSRRPRDPANAPDARERSILEGYHLRAAAGQSPMAMRTAALIERDGAPVVHFMQAIPTLAPCLACHGESIAPEVAARIAELYPDDRATGYRVGEIRGAFSLTRPFEPGFGREAPPGDRIAALELPESLALGPEGPTANPRLGREVFAARCQACHGAEAMARRYFGTPGAAGVEGLCLKLETHGATGPGQDCDLIAFLKAVAGAFAADRDAGAAE